MRAWRLLPLLLPCTLLGLWASALARGWVQPYQLPPPDRVLAAARELWASGELQAHVRDTLRRVAEGYALGVIPALLLGVAAGLVPAVRRLVDPTIQGLRAVPSLAWVPLFLLWFGIGETSRLLLIALGAALPAYLNTVAAVDGVDHRLVEVGRVYGLGRAAVIARIVLPAALPGILTGLRTAMGLAWMFVVAAELLAASSGLGFLLTDGQATGRPDRVLVSLLAFALLGRGSDGLLQALERRWLRWRDGLAEAGRP